MRKNKNYNSLPYNKSVSSRARELRQGQSLPEALFWNEIKNGKFHDLDFDRQKQIGNYFADFYCSELNLVIELDGKSHDYSYEYDKERDEYMNNLGITVIRISNEGVLHHIELELEHIAKKVEVIKNKSKNQEKTNIGQLSSALVSAMRETLAAGQQVLLFINRRGYAPIIQCKKCGWVAHCDECSCGMTYHKKTGGLLCHICGRTAPMLRACPDCGAELSMRGAGLEKIQEEVIAKFPGVRTALVSSDTMMSRQALERLVSQMENGEIDVIIGTQILAKGHHFPNLTLVGVIDADMGLFGADFRAAEHTFQQLFQVAGRAGRGDKPGRVLLQTYQPQHPVIKAICTNNRDEFMENDMLGRAAAKMPPFGQLVAVIIEAEKESVLQKYCAELAVAAPKFVGGGSVPKIMGPIPAQIYQIRKWFRMRFLVAGDEKAALQPAVRHWLGKVKQPVNVRVKIDVNPQSFM